MQQAVGVKAKVKVEKRSEIIIIPLYDAPLWLILSTLNDFAANMVCRSFLIRMLISVKSSQTGK